MTLANRLGRKPITATTTINELIAIAIEVERLRIEILLAKYEVILPADLQAKIKGGLYE
jgi:hypothetical protein